MYTCAEEKTYTSKPSGLYITSSLAIILLCYLCWNTKDPPVACVVRAGIVHPYNDEDMLKVRANDLGGEGVSARFLEHDGHYVVPYVALPQQLVIGKQQSMNFF